MTNGEKIKEIFPDFWINEMSHTVWVGYDDMSFRRKWWNAEYKEPTIQERQAESDKFDAAFQDEYNNGYAQARFDYEQDSTTKNCRSCRNFGSHHGICEICKDNKCWTEIKPTKNDLVVDCIDRQATLDAIIKRLGISNESYLLPAERTMYQQIKDMPSVTPQPKHGIWQQINKNEVNVIPEYRCSNCGAEYKGFGFDFDYCPTCGRPLSRKEVEE